jgi:hypothetical protein
MDDAVTIGSPQSIAVVPELYSNFVLNEVLISPEAHVVTHRPSYNVYLPVMYCLLTAGSQN